MHQPRLSIKNLLLLLLLTTAIASCRKENAGNFKNLSPYNQWILDSMRMYYYWSDQIADRGNNQGSANDFFKALLFERDRFSYMEDPSQPQTVYSSYSWYGFDYALISISTLPGQLAGVVTLVVPGGPADRQGLKRGDYFTMVNDIAVTNEAASMIQQMLRQGNGAKLQTAILENGIFTDPVAKFISYQYFTEQPVYMARIFINGNKKAGYLFYNQFNSSFDPLLLDSLDKFKRAGISELIVDMRYNPGGDVSTAAKIAAVAAPVNGDQVFAIYEANRNAGKLMYTFEKTIQQDNSTITFASIAHSRLALNKIIFLTSSATASAAELLINNLSPYIKTIQIGDTTIGKDMGSFPVYDQRIPQEINYVLHPLVFKLFNAKGKGNYSYGIAPDYVVDELNNLPLKPIGSPEDPLLNKALTLSIGLPVSIAGHTSTARVTGTPSFQSAQSRSMQAHPVSIKK